MVMKAIHYTPDSPYSLLKKAFSNSGFSGLSGYLAEVLYKEKVFFHSLAGRIAGYNISVKNIINYLVNAGLEGLKQNFLGPEIDMEFLVLTLRVYLIMVVRLALSHPPFISLKSL